MPDYEIQFKPSVEKDLRKISQNEQVKIIRKIDELSSNPQPQGCTKLTGEEKYRIRQGNYRIIYEIIEDKIIVLILRIRHRKDVYK